MKKQIEIYEMKYFGNRINTDIDLINYKNRYYKIFKDTICDSFKEISLKTGLDADIYYSKEELLERKDNIFILFNDEEIIGSVEIDNIIDHLFVNKKYQNKGYGKEILKFAINKLQTENILDIRLFVLKINKKAIDLYLKNNFKIINTIVEEW